MMPSNHSVGKTGPSCDIQGQTQRDDAILSRLGEAVLMHLILVLPRKNAAWSNDDGGLTRSRFTAVIEFKQRGWFNARFQLMADATTEIMLQSDHVEHEAKMHNERSENMNFVCEPLAERNKWDKSKSSVSRVLAEERR